MSHRLAAALATLVCFAVSVRADETEDKVVKLVEKYGGKITRDNTRPENPIVAIDLYNTFMLSSEFPALAELPHLTSLDLRRAANIGLPSLLANTAKFKRP